jgi:hypothetical protein
MELGAPCCRIGRDESAAPCGWSGATWARLPEIETCACGFMCGCSLEFQGRSGYVQRWSRGVRMRSCGDQPRRVQFHLHPPPLLQLQPNFLATSPQIRRRRPGLLSTPAQIPRSAVRRPQAVQNRALIIMRCFAYAWNVLGLSYSITASTGESHRRGSDHPDRSEPAGSHARINEYYGAR